MGGVLVFEIRSAAYPQKRMMVEFMGPTAQTIVGWVKQDFFKKHSLQTLNPRPL